MWVVSMYNIRLTVIYNLGGDFRNDKITKLSKLRGVGHNAARAHAWLLRHCISQSTTAINMQFAPLQYHMKRCFQEKNGANSQPRSDTVKQRFIDLFVDKTSD